MNNRNRFVGKAPKIKKKQRAVEGATDKDIITLCTQCALCCKGFFFSCVRVDRRKKKKIEKLGMPTHKITHADYALNQPCSGLSGEACTIYAARPEKCVEYHCLIAMQVMVGIINLKHGEKIISDVKKQIQWFSKQTQLMPIKNGERLNPYDFMHAYLKKARSLNKKGKLSKYDNTYAIRVFEYLKIIDRYFRKTGLIGKYATFIKQIR